MKKQAILAIFLAAVLFMIPVISTGVSAAMVKVYTKDKNVAAGKPYTASKPYAPTPATSGYHNIDGKELTDGETYAKKNPAVFSARYGSISTTEPDITITAFSPPLTSEKLQTDLLNSVLNVLPSRTAVSTLPQALPYSYQTTENHSKKSGSATRKRMLRFRISYASFRTPFPQDM